ncbi:MAG: 2-oxo acid dehydrogenase subunit E2 [Candidatus Odinarchaeota archaeon]
MLEGEIVIRSRMNLTLSIDHRVLDALYYLKKIYQFNHLPRTFECLKWF